MKHLIFIVAAIVSLKLLFCVVELIYNYIIKVKMYQILIPDYILSIIRANITINII